MTLALFAIRPEPGLSETLAAARALDLEISGFPLFDIEPLDGTPPSRDGFDGLLLGSANAVRHAGPALEQWRGGDAFVVGERTAAAAKAVGINVVRTGSGGLQSLLDEIADMAPYYGVHGTNGLKLLRLAGQEHVPLAPPAGFVIETCVVYRAVKRAIPDEFVGELRAGGVIMLHSGAAAHHFAEECDRTGIAREKLQLAALAPRVAEAAGAGWGGVATAPVPRDDGLLVLARDMCQ